MSPRDRIIKSATDLAKSVVFYNIDEEKLLGIGSYHSLLKGERPANDGSIILTKNFDQFTPPEIPLHVNLSQTHPLSYQILATKREEYESLKQKYPTENFYIDRALFPIPQIVLDNAKPNTIIYYDTRLVESQETDLIPCLDDYIYRFRHTWNQSTFMMADKYYLSSQVSVTYAFLLVEILKCRLDAVGTSKVHSAYLDEYLLSFGLHKTGVERLPFSNKILLGRDIRWLEKNIGQWQSLLKMVEDLTFNNNISVDNFELITTINDNVLSLDTIARSLLTGERKTHIPFPFYKEISGGLDKIETRYALDEVKRSLTTSLKITDLRVRTPIRFIDLVLGSLGKWTETGRYNAPLSLVEGVDTDMHNGFQYLMLLFMQKHNEVPDRFPCEVYLPVVHHTEATPIIFSSPDNIANLTAASGSATTAAELDIMAPPILPDTFVAPDSVGNSIKGIFASYNETHYYISAIINMRLRSVTKDIFRRQYPPAKVVLRSGNSDVQSWLTRRGIVMPDDDDVDKEIARVIELMTGIALDDISVTTIIADVIEALSSYTLRIIRPPDVPHAVPSGLEIGLMNLSIG